jgi:ribonuclease HII
MEKIKTVKNLSSPPLNPTLFEAEKWACQAYLCGIDEVGRGCLAGPVVTSAVILHPFKTHPLLKDSKILTEKMRRTAAEWIYRHSWYSFGVIDARFVDKLNIYKATQLAMKKALYGLFSASEVPRPDLILIDAMPLTLPGELNKIEIRSFPKGESKSVSIAAASILAKVKRDEMMQRMSLFFPGYDLSSNKGYGSPKHLSGLKDQNSSVIHRTTFLKNFKKKENDGKKGKQTSLF